MTDAHREVLEGSYAGGGAAWEAGPSRVYNRLAKVLVERAPVPLTGRLMLDCGAGTGAATRALIAAGAAVVALDAEADMLHQQQATRPLAIVASLLAMPFLDNAFGGAVAAFSLNHVADPEAGLREIDRVTTPGGPVLAAVFSTEQPAHPAKQIVEEVARSFGYVPPDWYARLKQDIEPLLGSADRFASAARDAGLHAVSVTEEHVDTGVSSAEDLVRWRLGMAHLGHFMRGLDVESQRRVTDAAEAAIGPHPQPLVATVLILSSLASA